MDFFRGHGLIRGADALADFIDQQSAFVARKGIYEYARARAGHYAKVLFKEPEFQAACDVARWQAFPIGLAMVADLRAELERRLKLVGFRAPKWAKDVPEPFAESYFNLMPIHEILRGNDFQTTRNYLRVTMTQVHDELTKRLDAPATAKSLMSSGAVQKFA